MRRESHTECKSRQISHIQLVSLSYGPESQDILVTRPSNRTFTPLPPFSRPVKWRG